MKRTRTGLAVAAALLIPVTLGAGAASGEDDPANLPENLNASALAAAIEDALTAGDAAGLTNAEEAAVDGYLASQADAGDVLTPQDVQVGTLNLEGEVNVTVVASDETPIPDNVVVAVDPEGSQIGVASASTDEASDFDAAIAQEGPGMGSWPSWDDSWHATIRLVVDVAGDGHPALGSADIQTYRRKYANDGNTAIDSWQISRYILGKPSDAYHNDTLDRVSVQRLWISQNPTDYTYDNYMQNPDREWLYNLTKPETNSTFCGDSAGFNVGPFSFPLSNCGSYDVWMGRIAHHRVDYDQGSVPDWGQRKSAYETGFTIDNGRSPAMTWYEFVTFKVSEPHDTPTFKCTSNAVGTANTTTTLTCDYN